MHEAIIKTLCYSQVFHFPLKAVEIHQRLIGKKATLLEVQKTLKNQKDIRIKDGFYFLYNQSIVARRINRQKISTRKMEEAQKLKQLFSKIPSIVAVFVTGTVAVGNANTSDDIDLLIITEPQKLWITRLVINGILDCMRKRRRPHEKTSSDKFCLNLWLTADNMKIEKARQNLYSAFEVVQARPIYEKNNASKQFLYENRWVKEYLPNTMIPVRPQKKPKLSSKTLFESIAFSLQKKYMESKKTRETVDVNFAFFHPRDTAELVLAKYKKLLQKHV